MLHSQAKLQDSLLVPDEIIFSTEKTHLEDRRNLQEGVKSRGIKFTHEHLTEQRLLHMNIDPASLAAMEKGGDKKIKIQSQNLPGEDR